jgi:hypothetical protein
MRANLISTSLQRGGNESKVKEGNRFNGFA